ncbi:MAG: hypothetical protein JXR70_06400 [Spirochaetales bacterium]|nr:hypothetical protein [Spirochaetales bacterium]
MKKAFIKSLFFMVIMILMSPLIMAECGDVDSNGTINIVDSLIVAKYYVSMNPDNFDSSVADVNNDQRINIVDALLIAQYYVTLIDSLSCAEPVSDEPLWRGGPYNLNGTSDYADVPEEMISGLKDFTIACWVHLSQIDSWSRIFDFGSSTDIFMMLSPSTGSSGNPYFAITLTGNDGEQGIEGDIKVQANVWQHYAVTKKGSTGILYINGREAGRSESINLAPSDMGPTNNNYIGRSQWSHDPYLKGFIDSFSIYNRPLSYAEIGELNSQKPVEITAGPTPEWTPGPTAQASRSFWSLDITKSEMEASAWFQLNATLAQEGQHCMVYIQEGRQVSSSVVTTLINEFDSNIWNSVTNNFGTPVDVDSNEKIILLLMDIRDGYSPPNNSSYVGGYFYGIDLYTNSQLRGLGYPSFLQSNEAELLYIDVYPNNPSSADFRSTVAHEFQHLVNMSVNTIKEGGNNTPVWINEGFSMAAEAIYEKVSILRSRESWYDNDPLMTGAGGYPKDSAKSITAGYPLVIWNPYPSNPYAVFNNYSLSHLFFAWLRIHMNSDSFFKEIMNSRDNGVGSIISVCSPVIGSEVDSFNKMLGHFWMANLLGGRGKTSGLDSYNGKNRHTGPQVYNGGNKSIQLYPGGSMYFNNLSLNNWSPSGGGSQISYAVGNINTLNADFTAPYGNNNYGSEILLVYNNESSGSRLGTSAMLPQVLFEPNQYQQFTKVSGAGAGTDLDIPPEGLRKGREPLDLELSPPENW